MISLKDYKAIPSGTSQFPIEFIQQCGALVLDEREETITIGVAKTSDWSLLKDIERYHKAGVEKKFTFVEIDNGELASFVFNLVTEQVASMKSRINESDLDGELLDQLANNAPIINLVNGIILDAVRCGASDIHFERQRSKAIVRYRLDGVLQLAREFPANIFPSISTRIKILSSLNILEQRRPQDGRFSVAHAQRSLDIRVSVVPTATGESLVLRILNIAEEPLTLFQLGLMPRQQQLLVDAIKKRQGIILMTGPTGSGKTTTLNAMIAAMNDGEKKIITIEDPVEFHISGVDQIQTNDDIGLSFSTILRRVLRQDPDVIMVGEIRDIDTAQLSIRASMTGHLVLSSLHTNNAVSTVHRLLDMDISPHFLAAVLQIICAQRLVRKLCTTCKTEVKNQQDRSRFLAEYKKLGFPVPSSNVSLFTADPNGCSACLGRGYKGRMAIMEIVPIDQEMRTLIESQIDQKSMEDYLRESGHPSLAYNALETVRVGMTSFEEVSQLILSGL
jgi:general secretion pathway protein E